MNDPKSSYARSLYSAWEYWLLVMLGAGLIVTPGSFSDAWVIYSGMSTESTRMEAIFRLIGFALTCIGIFGVLRTRFGARYSLLPNGVEARTGFLRGRSQGLRFRDIRGVESKKTVMGLLLGYASLRFHSERGRQDDIVFEHIEEGDLVREAVRAAIEAEQFPANHQNRELPTAPTSEVASSADAAAVENASIDQRPAPEHPSMQPVAAEQKANTPSSKGLEGISLAHASDEEIYTELARRAELRSAPINFESDTQA